MLKTVPELVAEAREGLRCLDAATALAEMKENDGTIVDALSSQGVVKNGLVVGASEDVLLPEDRASF